MIVMVIGQKSNENPENLTVINPMLIKTPTQ